MPELANPTIAMGIAQPTAPTLANPLEILHSYADTQRAMVEAQMAQKSMAARQRAGQIIASSPDMATAITGIQKDPLAAGYLPDIMSTLQGVSTSQTQQAGSQQTQNLEGLGTLIKNIAGAGITDPTAIKGAAQASLDAMSPVARAANQQSYGALVKSLTDGLDDPNMTPDARKNNFNQRLIGLAMGAGMPAEGFRSLLGSVAPSVQMIPGGGPGGADVMGVVGSPNLASKPGVAIAGQPGGPQFLTPDQKTALTALGAQEGDTAKQMSDAAAGAPAQLRNISLIQDALKVVNTGGGASNRSALASTAQMFKQAGFPITDAAISELANGKDGQVDGLPASQLISNELRAVALTNLKTAQESLGRASAPELNATIESLSNNMDPKLLQTVVDKMAYSIQMQKDRSDHYTTDYYKARQSGDVGPDSFNEYYNHNFLDGFNAKFEKEHPRVIGAPLPAAPKDAAAEKKSKLESIWGQ